LDNGPPEDPTEYTHSEYSHWLPVARASWRRLRASLGNSLSRTLEVLPHYYGTSTNDPSHRATESVLGEAHTNSRAGITAVKSGCIGCVRVDRHQFSYAAGIDFLRRAAAGVVGSIRVASARRAGDCTRESVGEQEAGVGSVTFRRDVARSGKGIQFRYDVESILPSGILAFGQNAGGSHAQTFYRHEYHGRLSYFYSFDLSVSQFAHPHVGVARD
jgi:hypothetical protein